VRVYADDSWDDVLGRPWVAGGLDDAQIELNQIVTLEKEYLRRHSRTQMLAQEGSIDDNTLSYLDDAIIRYAGEKPSFLNPPTAPQGLFQQAISAVEQYMYTVGGWQKASRGEGNAGDSGAKVAMLGEADDSIFATTNLEFYRSVSDGIQLGHALARESMFVPTTLNVSGVDMNRLAGRGITGADLMEDDPTFTLVQGSASPDAQTQQLLNLATTQTPSGDALLTVDEFHETVPDPSLRRLRPEIDTIRRARPYEINRAIEDACAEAAEQAQQMPPEWMPMLAEEIYLQIGEAYPLEDGDDPQMNMDALDELILDGTTPALVRQVARLRRQDHQMWAFMLAQAQQQPMQMQQQPGTGGGGQAAGAAPSMDPGVIHYQQAGGDAGQYPQAAAGGM
jgi:hypothetical protein